MGRAARITLGTGFLALMILYVVAAGVTGQVSNNTTNNTTGADIGGGIPASSYVVTFNEEKEDNTFLWDIKELHIPGGVNVTFIYDSAGATGQHNIGVVQKPFEEYTVADGVSASPVSQTLLPNSGRAAIDFTMPDEGEWTYVCTVHADTMVGPLSVGAFSTGGAAAAAAEGINEVGVHFLAYWVGVISFAVLFITYGASFFLFKHGETGETTDHKDRPGFEDKTSIMGLPEYVWAIIGILVIAAAVVLFFQIMLGGF